MGKAYIFVSSCGSATTMRPDSVRATTMRPDLGTRHDDAFLVQKGTSINIEEDVAFVIDAAPCTGSVRFFYVYLLSSSGVASRKD